MFINSFSIEGNELNQLTSTLPDMNSKSTLVLVFADPCFRDRPEVWSRIRGHFAESVILGCSTAGNISGREISDGSLQGVAAQFERTDLRLFCSSISGKNDSFAAGCRLGRLFPKNGLRAVFLLSEGVAINGTDLVNGLASELPPETGISGGLAGDGNSFKETWIVAGELLGPNLVAAVGFYGEHFRFSYGCEGGWDKFGVERRVTRSLGSVLYELDGKTCTQALQRILGS